MSSPFVSGQSTRLLGRDEVHQLLTVSNEISFSIEEAPEGGYSARALGHPMFTEADSEAELREQVRDAVRCHFDERDRPKMIRLHFVREDDIAA